MPRHPRPGGRDARRQRRACWRIVDVLGAQRPINLGMLEDTVVEPGEWVLIHMGFALERIDEAKAREAMAGLEMMGSSSAKPSRSTGVTRRA